MSELLEREFGPWPLAVALVSRHDATISYANPACVTGLDSQDWVGRHVSELSAVWGWTDWQALPVAQALDDDRGVIAAPSRRRPGLWLVASALDVDGEILGSAHVADDEQDAVLQHTAMALRVSSLLEYGHVLQLNRVARQMLDDSDVHLQRLRALFERSAPPIPHLPVEQATHGR